jgi:hypothetical protein
MEISPLWLICLLIGMGVILCILVCAAMVSLIDTKHK